MLDPGLSSVGMVGTTLRTSQLTSSIPFVSFTNTKTIDLVVHSRSRAMDPALSTRYIKNSLSISSTQMQLIQASARKHKITIALGFSENDHNSLYISQCIITDAGEIAMRRRKLMPTHMERTVFGNCSGNSLDNVVSTAVGNVGQLACWEHVQPLLKYHTITQREVFHVAAWPPVYDMAHEAELWSMTRDGE